MGYFFKKYGLLRKPELNQIMINDDIQFRFFLRRQQEQAVDLKFTIQTSNKLGDIFKYFWPP